MEKLYNAVYSGSRSTGDLPEQNHEIKRYVLQAFSEAAPITISNK